MGPGAPLHCARLGYGIRMLEALQEDKMNEYLTLKEVCGILHISRDTAARLCKPDKLTGRAQLENVRIGKIIRVSRSALQEYIDEHKAEAERYGRFKSGAAHSGGLTRLREDLLVRAPAF